nr:hypothetical transcript [Hymenolepis microstoma]
MCHKDNTSKVVGVALSRMDPNNIFASSLDMLDIATEQKIPTPGSTVSFQVGSQDRSSRKHTAANFSTTLMDCRIQAFILQPS